MGILSRTRLFLQTVPFLSNRRIHGCLFPHLSSEPQPCDRSPPSTAYLSVNDRWYCMLWYYTGMWASCLTSDFWDSQGHVKEMLEPLSHTAWCQRRADGFGRQNTTSWLLVTTSCFALGARNTGTDEGFVNHVNPSHLFLFLCFSPGFIWRICQPFCFEDLAVWGCCMQVHWNARWLPLHLLHHTCCVHSSAGAVWERPVWRCM